MLRLFVALLLIANVVYFSWTQGYFAFLGLSPVQNREPERLQLQVNANRLELLETQAPSTASSSATSATPGAPPPSSP